VDYSGVRYFPWSIRYIVNTVMNVTHTAARTAVSTVNSYSMENQATMVQFLAEARDLSILDNIQTAPNYMQPPVQQEVGNVSPRAQWPGS
jgi:hypothetical protein